MYFLFALLSTTKFASVTNHEISTGYCIDEEIYGGQLSWYSPLITKIKKVWLKTRKSDKSTNFEEKFLQKFEMH